MVFEKIKSMLSEQLGISADTITMESNIISDLGADSLDIVEMIMALEETYNLQVPDDTASELKTVGARKQIRRKQINFKTAFKAVFYCR